MSSSSQPENPGVQGTGSGTQNFLVSFGPGLLWAGSAIGVSHLVQSTRAGATAGFALTGVIIFALILKYPFFEFGPRYAAATGESLVEGYRRIGRWALWLYLLIMLSTVVFTNAAILLFTEALFQYALGTSFSPTLASAVVYSGCLLLLWVGHYKALDLAIKIVVLVLALSTLVAASLILPQADFSDLSLLPLMPSGGTVTLAFMIAIAGWMPVGIEAATLSSLWTLAKDKSTNVRTSVSTARLDFNIAYVGTGVLAFAFLILGAVVMYGSGEEFSASPAGFSTQLIQLYESTLGGWAGPIMVTAAVTAMFSTTLTVMDGYPRAIDRAIKVIKTDDPDQTANADISEPYWIALIGIGVLMTLFLHFFVSSLTQMIDFITIVSFMAGPILGYLNLKAVTSPHVPKEHQPGKAMVAFSYFGLVSMVVVAIIFLMSRVGLSALPGLILMTILLVPIIGLGMLVYVLYSNRKRKGERMAPYSGQSQGSGEWIVRLPGQPETPVSIAKLQMWARSGVIKPDSLIEEVATGQTYSATQIPRVFSDKSFVTTIVLSVLVGSLGVDRFYLGYIGLGILKLLTFGACGIWTLVDLILIAMRKIPDADGRPLG